MKPHAPFEVPPSEMLNGVVVPILCIDCEKFCDPNEIESHNCPHPDIENGNVDEKNDSNAP